MATIAEMYTMATNAHARCNHNSIPFGTNFTDDADLSRILIIDTEAGLWQEDKPKSEAF